MSITRRSHSQPPTSRIPALPRWCPWALATLVLVPAASGLTYVPVADATLADQADLIVLGEVLGAQVHGEGGAIRTDYRIRIDELVGGYLPASEVAVRVLGGETAEGRGLFVPGAPRLQTGQRTLLFLRSDGQGTFRPLHVFQGVFHEIEVAGEPLFLRRYTGTHSVASLDKTTGSPQADRVPVRKKDAFLAWLRDRKAGVVRAEDYATSVPYSDLGTDALLAGEIPPGLEKFTLILESPIIRWFEFDRGEPVRWFRHEDGLASLPDGGRPQFVRSLAIWNSEPSTPVVLVDAGENDDDDGFEGEFDGINTILFDDRNNDLDTDYSCFSGGVLAAAGVIYVFSRDETWKGEPARAAAEAAIVVNDGVDCVITKTMEEVFAHELGHTLGLGHSCGDPPDSPICQVGSAEVDALMNARAHGDGRGARLGVDDVRGLRYLYDESFTGQPYTGGCALPVGHPHYCRDCGPCADGEGDCDRDGDCETGLACVDDIGAQFGFGPSIDVCVAGGGGGGGGGGCPVSPGHPDRCALCGPCADGEGDCDRDTDCVAGATCVDNVGATYGYGPGIDVCVAGGGGGGGGGCNLPGGDPNYCNVCGPCADGEGDCDRDTDCVAGATCVQDVGATYGFNPGIDVCVAGGGGGGCPLPAGHANYCRDCGPCASGEGDCEPGQCAAGLTCVDDIGAQFGFGPGIDVCQ